MVDDAPIPQMSAFVWYFKSLGIRYTLLLPLVSAISLLLIWKSTSRSSSTITDGSRLTAWLMLVVPLPAVVGLFTVVDGLLAGFSTMGCGVPTAAEYADIWSMSLVGLQVGLWLTMPGMLLAKAVLCRQAMLQNPSLLAQEKR